MIALGKKPWNFCSVELCLFFYEIFSHCFELVFDLIVDLNISILSPHVKPFLVKHKNNLIGTSFTFAGGGVHFQVHYEIFVRCNQQYLFEKNLGLC